MQIPPCSHRPPCPGCPRFGAADIAPAARATLEALAQAHGVIEVPVVTGELQAFRHRARLAIRGRLGSPKVGLFELGTHRVVHIPHCIIHHPLINRVAAVVRRALVETRVPPYSDKAHLGLARYLQVVVERHSQTAQVVLVVNSAEQAVFAPCLDLIRERLGPELHSLWLNRQQEPTNTVLGAGFHRWCGPESVVEHFGGAAVHYPPGAFGQNNLEIAQAIVEHVRPLIPEGSRIAEFYAGVGAIGLSVLGRASAMTLNEVSPHSRRGLELGLSGLQPLERCKVTVIPGPASAARSSASAAHVVIADPPRKGLEPELIDHLATLPPERFIYISCGIDSFAADVVHLTANGRLRLASLAAFNLTPFTEHVETVACFERV